MSSERRDKMGLRFRKSFKIAPGIKVNFNKKSVGATLGTKGAHYTINSSGRKTSSVGIPGTGISYSTTSGGGNSNAVKPSSKSASSTNASSGSGGCLKTFATIGFALTVLVIVLNYAWIPGIIAAIYFWKKTPDKKQRKIRVGISIVITLLSFMFFLTSMFEPELQTLTVNWDKQEYDINEEVILDLEVLEEGAKIYSLDISDNEIASVSYVNDVATVSFKSEGTADISFIANDEVHSNVTTIIVIDREAEEQRAKEEAERKAQEEAERKAAEEAAKKEQEESQKQEVPQEEMVWISSSGSRYHSKASCSNMENPTEVTISTAKSRNLTPCKRCY